jgi:hypothetical protein
MWRFIKLGIGIVAVCLLLGCEEEAAIVPACVETDHVRALAARGFLNERGRPYAAKSIASMLCQELLKVPNASRRAVGSLVSAELVRRFAA